MPASSALLTDLYQLTMLGGYVSRGMHDTAVFEFFVRELPDNRNFLMTAGLEQLLEFVEGLRFSRADIDWLASTGYFHADLLDYLAEFRFRGDVWAMPEGTLLFENEPVVQVLASLPEAQLIESRLINLMHFQTVVASKAARCVLARPDKLLVDFGLRRSHGAEAGLLAARACYIAGYAGSATVLAAREFGIPVYGTMAHSFVQAHESELDALEHFARTYPENTILLIDTYDTSAAAEGVTRLAKRLRRDGIEVRGVRIDSGDLPALARQVRRILDDNGCKDVTIFCSGGLDEYALAADFRDAPVDGFGLGTSVDVSADAPYLDCAYKIQEYAGRATRKKSSGKATLPGRKQVYRHYDQEGRIAGDLITLADDESDGTPLLRPVMTNGARLEPSPKLDDVRAHAARELGTLPESLRDPLRQGSYPVTIAGTVQALVEEVDHARSRSNAACLAPEGC